MSEHRNARTRVTAPNALRSQAAQRSRDRRAADASASAALAAILRTYSFDDNTNLRCRAYPDLVSVPLSRNGVRHAALLSGVLISEGEAAVAYAALGRLALQIAARRAAVTDPADRRAIQCVVETDALIAYSAQTTAATGRGGAA